MSTNIGTWTISDQRGNALAFSSQYVLDLAATGLNEILQNIFVICNTRIGSVMLDRKFGLEQRFLDAPQNQAQLMIVVQVCQGITYFEPRATFKKIEFGIDRSTMAMNVGLSVNIDVKELTAPSR